MNHNFKLSYLLSLNDSSKQLFGLIITLSFIWGSIVKLFIYNYVKTLNIRDRPINALILLGEIIYHKGITFVTLNLLVVLYAKQTPAEFFFDQLGITINENVSTKFLEEAQNLYSIAKFSVKIIS
jgi:hypothetical protein